MNREKNSPVGDIRRRCFREAGRCSSLIAFCSFRGNDVFLFAIAERREILRNFEM